MKTAKEIAAKVIRVVTIPPVCAAVLISLLFFAGDGLIKDTPHYAAALLFLAVMPVAAYPVSVFSKKENRRSFQRSLAIVFAVIGYVGGTVFAFLSGAPKGEVVLYLTYLFSGILMFVFSFIFTVKASGHACGFTGPIAMLAYQLGPRYLVLAVLLIAVYSSSLILKRHTPPQLALGSVLPVISMFIAIAVA